MNIKEFNQSLTELLDKSAKFDQIKDFDLALNPVNCVALDIEQVEKILLKMKSVGSDTVFITDGCAITVQVDRDCPCGCGGTETYTYSVDCEVPEFFHS